MSQLIENDIDVSVVIVSYNTRTLTLECLESLYQQTRSICFETLVVDNASSDQSAEAIAKYFSQVRLIPLKENLGFARANNLAIKKARGHYVLLLNSDTVVLEGAIDRLFDFSQQYPQAGIWGGKTLFADGTLNPTACYRRMSLWSLFCRSVGLSVLFKNSNWFNPETFGNWENDYVRNVDIVTGCFLLIPLSLWKELNGFDERFFMFGEEVDLCLRAGKFGYKPMVTPDACIIHYGGKSEPCSLSRWQKVFQSKLTLIQMHWKKRHFGFGRAMLLLWVFTRAILLSIPVGKMSEKRKIQKAKWVHLWRQRHKWLARFQN